MQDWLIDRIDFIDGTPCHFCNRRLKTNIAYILIGEVGEVPSGPSCAKKNGSNHGARIPDFTKASLDVADEDDDGNGGNSKPSTGGAKSKPTGFSELEYLRLRAEKLTGFKDAMYPKLSEIYQKYKSTGLDESDVSYLANLIKKISAEKPLLSPKNLQNCYAYAFWLRKFLKKKGRNDFASSVLNQLQQKLQLSEPQIVAINKLFQYIERMPVLDPKAFS